MTAISILIDAPGPRALRRQRAMTGLVAVVLIVAFVFAYRRLDDRGQLDGQRWRIFRQWSVWRFYLVGLLNTTKAAAAGGTLALIVGLVCALGRTSTRRVVRVLSTTYVEVFRALPLALLMFFALLAMPKIGIDLSPFWAVVAGPRCVQLSGLR